MIATLSQGLTPTHSFKMLQKDWKLKYIRNFLFFSSKDVSSQYITELNPSDSFLPPLESFLIKLLQKSSTLESCAIVALIYMARFNQSVKDSQSSVYNARKIYLTCLILATKIMIEPGYTNGAWSKLTRMSLREINDYESTVLKAIQFRLHVSEKEYQFWKHYLSGK